MNDIRLSRDKVKKIEDEIYDIENKVSLKKYLSDTKALRAEYETLATDAVKGIVNFGAVVESDSEEKVKQRLDIINKYLEIARVYININVTHQSYTEVKCPGCGILTEEEEEDEDDDNVIICPECQYEYIRLSKQSAYSDAPRVNISNRNGYEDRENYIKTLLCIQGKQPNKVPALLYEQLNAYFKKRGGPTREEILSLPNLEDGKKEGTSMRILTQALSDTHNSAFFEDRFLIANVFWKWKLIDLGNRMDELIDLYDKTQTVYLSLEKGDDRRASLNTQFRAFVSLSAIGIKCDRNDYRIPDDTKSLLFHQKMWKIMLDTVRVNNPSLIYVSIL